MASPSQTVPTLLAGSGPTHNAAMLSLYFFCLHSFGKELCQANLEHPMSEYGLPSCPSLPELSLARGDGAGGHGLHAVCYQPIQGSFALGHHLLSLQCPHSEPFTEMLVCTGCRGAKA